MTRTVKTIIALLCCCLLFFVLAIAGARNSVAVIVPLFAALSSVVLIWRPQPRGADGKFQGK